MKKKSPVLISLFQALGIIFYISLVATVMYNGNTWFGTKDTFLTPILVLTMFAISVSTCGILMFAYPIYLFWDKKKTKKSIKIVIYTTLWLFAFFMIIASNMLIK